MISERPAQRVLGATGVLAEFDAAEVLSAADIHTANLLGRLWEEPDERVLLAAALTVRALRSGSVCVDITRLAEATIESLEETPAELPWPDPTDWAAAIRRSPMIADEHTDTVRPLRLVGNLLYLERYWQTEQVVRDQLDQRHASTPPIAEAQILRRHLDALFDDDELPAGEPDQQRLAAAMTALSQVTVVAGGPGTGKTTTVARILALHRAVRESPPVVALAAPTGKAAARLEEAVRQATDRLSEPWSRLPARTPATTLHRLLGLRKGQVRPRHTEDNPLPHDLIVVDEMSMVSLEMMRHLLVALRPDARLVLVGDPDQLSSVDAGAVLADITRSARACPDDISTALAELAPSNRPPAIPTGAGVVTLQHTWRFDGAIGAFAKAVRAGDAEAALAVLRSGDPSVRLCEADQQISSEIVPELRDRVVASGRRLHAAALDGDPAQALDALEEHRLLCAHRRGRFGVAYWERQVTDWLRAAIPGYGTEGDLYPGLPLMVTTNDPEAGLYNGDTGVVVRTPTGLKAAFARGGTPELVSTLQLNDVTGVHAMTVHKSQGSQFKRVALVLPPVTSPLLTRELLYTAVTRASAAVDIVGFPEAVVRAVQRPANRASGLGVRGG